MKSVLIALDDFVIQSNKKNIYNLKHLCPVGSFHSAMEYFITVIVVLNKLTDNLTNNIVICSF